MSMVRRAAWSIVAIGLVGCSAAATPAPNALSCQPYGSTPAPIDISYPTGPVTSAVAERTAIALFRSCERSSAITELTSGSVSATGTQRGPNAGQAVWLVQVDATITGQPPAAPYAAHFLIEVNAATGVPTIIGQG